MEKGEQDFKNIFSTIRWEWESYYSNYSKGIVGTLRAISGIDKATTSRCLASIQAASQWESNKKTYEQMIAAMEEADTLITNMDMDQDITSFLQKMNMGQATLADLSPKVGAWIEKEAFTNKIRLSFATQ